MTLPLYAVLGVLAVILVLTGLVAALIGLLIGKRTSTPAEAGDVIERLGKLKEALEQLKEINREANNDTRKLQETLTHPKHRGMLGERLLEAVLGNVLPPGMFNRQYAFANGEVVDAAIFIDKKIVPIDAKFPLENYNRWAEATDGERPTYEKAFINDLKQRIDETAKYIRPAERTMEFAFMYIPAEGIYYDLLANRVGGDSLVQYAAAKRVIVVSPASLLAYLQTVMQGLRALEIEEKAAEIEARVSELGKHVGAYVDFYRKLGNALGIAVNHYNAGTKELKKIDTDVLRITDKAIGVELAVVDKPNEAA
jgi:DNA recombination protein RmuC